MREPSERTLAEMARGRAVVELNQRKTAVEDTVADRREILARMSETRRLHMLPRGKNMEAWVFRTALIDGEDFTLRGTLAATEAVGPFFPTEQYVTQVTLAFASIAGWEGVPDYSATRRLEMERREQDRSRRDTYRDKHVINWGNT